MGTRTHRGDGSHQCTFGGVDEASVGVGHRADSHRERRVAVPPVDDGPAIDRQQVAVVEHSCAGDAMDHLVVDRRADDRRKSVVAEEVALGPTPLEHVASEGIEVRRGDPGTSGLADHLVHLRHHTARPPHRLQLGVPSGDEAAHRQVLRAASTAAVSSAKTRSGVPTPSMTTRRPAAP